MAAYYVNLEYDEKFSGVAEAKFLFGAIRYVRNFTLKEADNEWYVFGFKLKKKKKDNADESKAIGRSRKKPEGKSTVEKIKATIKFLLDKSNQRLLNLVKETFLKLLNQLRPKQVEGDFEFGLGDPYFTGKLLEIFAILYATMGDKLKVIPHWDELMFKGEITCEGRFSPFYVLHTGLKLWNDEDFRKWRKEYNGK